MCYNGGMETHDLAQDSGEGGRKGLVVILLVAAVLAVGLVVAIVVLNLRPAGMSDEIPVEDIDLSEFQDIEGSEVSANDALTKCYEIRRSFTDGGYDLEEVKQEYEANMATNDAAYNLYITMCYADFVYDYDGGLDAALNVADLAKPLPKAVDVQAHYYVSLRDIYEKAGNEAGVRYCEQMLEQLMPTEPPVDDPSMVEEEE